MTICIPKRNWICVLALFLLAFSTIPAKAQTRDEVIHGSYFVAFGRFASSDELRYWRQNVGNRTIGDMVSNHKNYLHSNKQERENTVRRSFMDAFGWNPSADELRYWVGEKKTYAELMSNHINKWLDVYPDKKDHVVRQSYYKVFNRNATDAEVQYWRKQPTYSFVQLVAIHSTWKQKNQVTSKATGLLPNLKVNDISTAGMSPQAIQGVIAAGGMNVIAPGGGNVVAAGGMNVVAPGGGN